MPAWCFLWHCLTDSMTCDPIVHLDAIEFARLLIFVCYDWVSIAPFSGFLTCKPLCFVCQTYEQREWLPCLWFYPLFTRTHLGFFLQDLLSVAEKPPKFIMRVVPCEQRDVLFCIWQTLNLTNWTEMPRQYDTICFLPCSGFSAGCPGISYYLSILELVKSTI